MTHLRYRLVIKQLSFLIGMLLLAGTLLARADRSEAATTIPATFGFGLQITQQNILSTVARARAGNITWMRFGELLWSQVEPTAGQRNWPSAVDQQIIALAQGNVPMVVMRTAPTWAQRQPPGYACGPIKNDATTLSRFRAFVRDSVERYDGDGVQDVAGLPRGVKYWEFWNEPDAPYSIITGTSPFGCWGDINDPYLGGGYYGEILKTFYAAVKEADPAGQVIIGGLLLGCAADPGGGCDLSDSPETNFLEGILRNGGGNYFDMVAYHAYAYYDSTLHDWDLDDPKWGPTGGVLLGKLNFIRDVLGRYGAGNKPIIMNEGGLIMCHNCPAPADYYNKQANYLVRFYTRGWANGLKGVIWYTLDYPGFRYNGLLDASQNPRPAYTTLILLSTKLNGATYAGRISTPAGTEGYKFTRGTSEIHIYWSNSAQIATIATPANRMAVYNTYGQRINTGPTLTIGFEPIIVETHRTQYLTGDFNADGRGDVVRGYHSWDSMPACLSTGSGWSCSDQPAPRHDDNSVSLVGDFNGDGRDDVAQASPVWGSFPVCHANGSGGWSCTNNAATVHGGGTSTKYLAGDFNNDGRTDIVQANPAWSSFPVCHATGNGAWSCFNNAATVYGGGANTTYLAGDFNGDGRDDIAQANPAWGSFPVCHATGNGAWTCFNSGATIQPGSGTKYMTGDFNADGRDDIVQINLAWQNYPVCFATGTGAWSCTVQPATVYNFDAEGQFHVADFNGDGRSDIAQTHRNWGSIPLCLANGSGGWSCTNTGATIYNANSAEQRFLATDVNNDNKADIVQVYGGWLSMPTCRSNGNGSWACSNPGSQ